MDVLQTQNVEAASTPERGVSTPVHRSVSDQRVPALDGIRGFAIILVLAFHVSAYMPASWRAYKSVMHAGQSGVDLFFVLSGFLITGILLDTKTSANYFQTFYVRRFLRIFPLYYAALGGIFLIATVFGCFGKGWFPPRADWRFYFAYLNNWRPLLNAQLQANVIGHFWSLAVEEQFYLLWPLFVWFIPARRLPVAAMTGVIASLALRAILLVIYGPIPDVFENTFCRMDNLLLGALATCLVRSVVLRQRATPYIRTGVPVAAFGFFLSEFLAEPALALSFGLLCRGVLFFGLLLWCFETRHTVCRLQSLLQLTGLRTFGKYSYGLYVIHVPIFYFLALLGATKLDAISFCVLAIGLSFTLAVLSFEFLERPFLRLRNRFSPF